MNKDITFCSPEGNKCKHRYKCYRYTCEHGKEEYVWWADFWREYGKDCKYFIQDTTSKKQEVQALDKDTTLPDLPEDSKCPTPRSFKRSFRQRNKD